MSTFHEKIKNEELEYLKLRVAGLKLFDRVEHDSKIKLALQKITDTLGCRATTEQCELFSSFLRNNKKDINLVIEMATQSIIRLDSLDVNHVIERRQRKNVIKRLQDLIDAVEILCETFEKIIAGSELDQCVDTANTSTTANYIPLSISLKNDYCPIKISAGYMSMYKAKQVQ